MKRKSFWSAWIVVFMSLSFTPGCGNRIIVAPCSGTLSLDGKPLPDCVLRLSLAESPKKTENVPAVGRTDAQGRFTLKTLEKTPRNGAPVGQCVVMVHYNPEPPPGVAPEDYAESPEYLAAKPRLPENAADGTLRFTVPKNGTRDARIELNTSN